MTLNHLNFILFTTHKKNDHDKSSNWDDHSNHINHFTAKKQGLTVHHWPSEWPSSRQLTVEMSAFERATEWKCVEWLVGGFKHFFFSIIYGNFIIPTDELIFFRGVGLNHQPERRWMGLMMAHRVGLNNLSLPAHMSSGGEAWGWRLPCSPVLNWTKGNQSLRFHLIKTHESPCFCFFFWYMSPMFSYV